MNNTNIIQLEKSKTNQPTNLPSLLASFFLSLKLHILSSSLLSLCSVVFTMEFRSKSCRSKSLQIENYNGRRVAPTSMQDLRSYNYSASYGGSAYPCKIGKEKEVKVDKGKNIANKVSKSSSFSDPELQRKKRVAGYKIYSVEGKMKGSLRKSLRWIKNTCTEVVHGWW